MDNPDLKPQLEAVVPGVFDAYHSLKSHDGMGLHTSSGSFYNHTLFGRDGSMAAKFVADFDHDIVCETIIALAALQGTENDPRTQEQPGRIHHELRDFRTWRGSLADRILFLPWYRLWGVRNRQLLTYFSVDTTASYIRLVHKYAKHIDASILLRKVTNHHGEVVTIAESLVAAAGWIIDKVQDDGRMVNTRRNRWSLPFQTYQDSLTTYSRADGSLANYIQPISYVEVQAFAADALDDMAELFPGHDLTLAWRETARRMHNALVDSFWDNQQKFFASAIDADGPLDVPNISAGWTLNTSLWREMEDEELASYIGPIVERLFSDEFLTTVGLRTMSKDAQLPVDEIIGYHSPEVVWPMFTFMVVEGLRRHRLYGLATQLENRILNSLNATGNFDEFFIVLRDGTVALQADKGSDGTLKVQMPPEKRIGFTVVPAMTMAKRSSYHDEHLPQNDWQKKLEKKILEKIDHIDRAEPADALKALGNVRYVRLNRWSGAWESFKYFRRETKRMQK
jgi:glycogen debranching enzyme